MKVGIYESLIGNDISHEVAVSKITSNDLSFGIKFKNWNGSRCTIIAVDSYISATIQTLPEFIDDISIDDTKKNLLEKYEGKKYIATYSNCDVQNFFNTISDVIDYIQKEISV